MKRKVLSVISFVLSVLTVISMAACTAGGNSGSAKKANVSLGKPLNEKGAFVYSLMRAQGTSDEIESAIKELRNEIYLNFNTSAKLLRDTVKYDENAKEILIGNTNRPESDEAKKIVEKNRENNSQDFIVKVIGSKIVINAVTDEALINAVTFFKDSFCKSEDTWYYLYNNYSFLYAPEYDTAEHSIAGEPISKYKIVTAEKNSRIVTSSIEKFRETFFKNAGIEIKAEDDGSKAEDYEIIIGETGRNEKIEKPEAGKFSIAVVGKKLILSAGDDPALAGAVDYITNKYNEAIENKTAMKFDSGFSVTEEYVAGDNGYKYVWGDEFNGKELNRRLWVNNGDTYETVSCLGSRCLARKSEECYVRDGCAVIFGTHDSKTDDFTHRQISTNGTHEFLYGCIEFRAKLAEAPAANALWFNTSKLRANNTEYNFTQEIDLLEDFGKPKSFAANIHRWWTNESGSGHSSLDGGKFAKAKKYTVSEDAEPLSNDFHIYSFQWTPDIMNFCVDGKVFFSYSIGDDVDGKGTDVFHTPMMTMMSATLGAATYSAKWTRSDKDYYELLVDYVRLYQRDCDNGYSKETLKG